LEPLAPREIPTNLPAQLAPLIGREREVAEASLLLGDAGMRLVSLVGPGGTGKTRLAIELGWKLRERFPDGVFMVNLTPVRDPGQLLSCIAQVLGVKESGAKPLAEQLKEHLRNRKLLMPLDNFEQIIAAAPQVAQLLAAAPHLAILVTSRTALQISGEREYPITPLPLPDRKVLPRSKSQRLELLRANPAIQLFLQRATAVKPAFELTSENGDHIAQIVERLDGLPLAIELAAARSKILTPQAILSRLNKSLGLLTGGARDHAAHQQTLRSTIAWSYDLLQAAEQQLFARMAVFVGGSTLESIEAVCHSSGALELDILDGVSSLVEKSLLRQSEGDDGEPRFAMLATIAEFALEQLETTNELETLRNAHASYFHRFAAQANQELNGPGRERALVQMEQEHDNLRAALDFSIEHASPEESIAFGATIWRLWAYRGYYSEGRRWVDRLLRLPATTGNASNDLVLGAGSLAMSQSDYSAAAAYFETYYAASKDAGDQKGEMMALLNGGIAIRRLGRDNEARERYEQALSIAQMIKHAAGEMVALNSLGSIAYASGANTEAEQYYQAVVELARKHNNQRNLSEGLCNLALSHVRLKRFAEAEEALRESIELAHQLNNRVVLGGAFYGAGLLALTQGDPQQARERLIDSLLIRQELGDRDGIARVLEAMASAKQLLGDNESAAKLWGAAQALREIIKTPLPQGYLSGYEQSIAAVRAALGNDAFAAAWAAGNVLTLEAVVNEAIGEDGAGI
jgi:predicted ATPase